MVSPNPQVTFSARFIVAVAALLKAEGGYNNLAADHGGATNFGISLRFLVSEGRIDTNRDGRADFDLDMDGDIDAADIAKLSADDAQALYHRCFWLKLGCDHIPFPLGEMMFDQAVNGGLAAAVKLLQKAILFCNGACKVDGVVGFATLDEMTRVIASPHQGMGRLITAYREMVKARYRAIASANPSQSQFLRGWLNRAERLGRG